jgi:hypothetical protein
VRSGGPTIQSAIVETAADPDHTVAPSSWAVMLTTQSAMFTLMLARLPDVCESRQAVTAKRPSAMTASPAQ